jgi:hypothetical protein
MNRIATIVVSAFFAICSVIALADEPTTVAVIGRVIWVTRWDQSYPKPDIELSTEAVTLPAPNFRNW